MSATNFSGPVVSAAGFTGDVTGGATVPVVSLAAAATLTAAQSGSIIALTGTTGYAVTLPAPAAGLNYTFIVQDLFGTTDWVITSASADMFGTVMELSTVQAIASATTINLELAADTIGDRIKVESDGTNWYVSGAMAQAASVTPA